MGKLRVGKFRRIRDHLVQPALVDQFQQVVPIVGQKVGKELGRLVLRLFRRQDYDLNDLHGGSHSAKTDRYDAAKAKVFVLAVVKTSGRAPAPAVAGRGFHPFHYGNAYASFPSGHAAVVFSVLSILWLSYPRWQFWYAMFGVAVCVGLVALNFHFVSDVIAGAMLGSITGVWMTQLFRLKLSQS